MFIKKVLSLMLLLIFQLIQNLEPETYYKLPQIQKPQQVIPYSNEYFLIVKNDKVYKYSFNTNILEKVATRTQNELVGITKNESLIYCNFTHNLIDSYDDYSTTFNILDENKNKLHTYKFFETIRPLEIDEQTIIAKTAVDFLEQHYYEIDIETGEYREIEEPKENKIYLNLDLDWKKIYLHNQRILIQDKDGYLFAF